MSLRGVWVVHSSDANFNIIYSKRYMTVEKRAQKICKDTPQFYSEIPKDTVFVDSVLKEYNPAESANLYFVRSCTKPWTKPVYEVVDGKIWPVVCIQKKSIYFVAVPLVESYQNGRPHLIETPSVSAALELLVSLAQHSSSSYEKLISAEYLFPSTINQFLAMSAPFGTIIDTSYSNVHSMLPFALEQATASSYDELPSWKPVLFKGNPKLTFTITEQVQSCQWIPNSASSCELYGSVSCKAELEGLPEISLSLTIQQGGFELRSICTHPNILKFDTVEQAPSAEESSHNDLASVAIHPAKNSSSIKLKVRPPLGTFSLFEYSCSERWRYLHTDFIPIRGYYDMKGEQKVEIVVHLELNERIRNNFEFFDVHIPLFNRGQIITADILPSTMQVNIANDQRMLIWNIGQKFPKSLEIELAATVTFSDEPPSEPSQYDDAFCVNETSYLLINFRLADFTLSTLNIDPRSVVPFPTSKYKMVISKELITSEYKFWNIHGNSNLPNIV